MFFSRKLVPLSQSIRCKTNTIHELVDGTFKALSILLVFTSCSYRLLWTFFVLIGRFDNFDFVFTKFNQNARYVIMRVSLLFRSLIFREMRKIASSKQTKGFKKIFRNNLKNHFYRLNNSLMYHQFETVFPPPPNP